MNVRGAGGRMVACSVNPAEATVAGPRSESPAIEYPGQPWWDRWEQMTGRPVPELLKVNTRVSKGRRAPPEKKQRIQELQAYIQGKQKERGCRRKGKQQKGKEK